MDAHRAELAAESLPSEVALLDATGVITWANGLWLRAAGTGSDDLLTGCTVGVDFLQCCRSKKTPTAEAVAMGVAAVIARRRDRFEHVIGSEAGSRRWDLQASPLRGSDRGAVVLRAEIRTAASTAAWDLVAAEDVPDRIARLTPRERDVLKLMSRGLGNREIAAELGLAYATVRSHAQSVIEKLGARSRLEAVARVARADLAGIMDSVPLGIGDQTVPLPSHLGLFYDTEPDMRRIELEVLRPAIEDSLQGIVLFGPPGIARRMREHLEADLGRSLEAEVSGGRILVAQTDSDPDQLLENIREAFATLKARGYPIIRLFGDVKWGAPGFPPPEDALWVESRVNDMLADTGALVVCAYDVSRLPDKALILGALQSHPIMVIGEWVAQNPSYLAPEDYMRAFFLRMRSRKPRADRTSSAPRAPE